jgi:hypothetical protein
MSYTDHHPAASPFICRVVHKLYDAEMLNPLASLT